MWLRWRHLGVGRLGCPAVMAALTVMPASRYGTTTAEDPMDRATVGETALHGDGVRHGRTGEAQRRRTALLPPCLLLLLALAAGCGGGSGTAGGTAGTATTVAGGVVVTTKPPLVGASCLQAGERRGAVRFRSGSGAEVAGVVLGRGRAGVVLAHQAIGTLCDWFPYARELSRLGYRVLALDLNGHGASPPSPGSPANPRWDLDVAAATALLRQRGVGKVVLVGAGAVGGTSVVVAAADIQPPVAGVVDLSGPGKVSGLDAANAATRLVVPALFIMAADDSVAVQPPGLRAVYQTARASDRRLEVVPGGSHGVHLLDPDQEPKARRIRQLVEAFIRERTAAA